MKRFFIVSIVSVFQLRLDRKIMVRGNLKNSLRTYHNAIADSASFLVASLIFVSGIGRYRCVLLYGLYFLLRAVLSLFSFDRKVLMIFLPLVIISLFFDITKGQIFPVFKKNYLFIAVPLLLIADMIIKRFVGRSIEQLARGELFATCPSCGYDNKDLVERCKNCSYQKGDQLLVRLTTEGLSAIGNRIPFRAFSLLGLQQNEKLLFHKKIASNVFSINGVNQARTNLVITNERIIFLDYFRFPIRSSDGWRERDSIPLSSISNIECKMKKIYLTKEALLGINTASNLYEIVFRKRNIREILEILNIIRTAYPEVDIRNQLMETENPWKIHLD